MKSLAEESFALAWSRVAPSGHDTQREYQFHPTRRWRFDFAWPSIKLAVEIQGRGRHQTVGGVRSDCEKNNAAITDGWAVMAFPATDHKQADDWARQVLLAMVGRTQWA